MHLHIRKIGRGMVPGLLAGALIMFGPSAATLAASSSHAGLARAAQPQSYLHYYNLFEDNQTGLCLDNNGYIGDGHVVDGATCTDNSGWEVWAVYKNADGSARIVTHGTGNCLDSNYQYQVYALPCNGGNYQNWWISYAPDGTMRLIDDQTGNCLDSYYYANVYTFPCIGGNFQNWVASPGYV